jgi:predicted alpha/beta hydrolase family esterase
MSAAAVATVLIVPGLRDHVAQHWQTLLAEQLAAAGKPVRTVPPMGRDDLDCATRVVAIDRELAAIEGPVVIVAHSGGVIMLAHWAAWAKRTQRDIRGALLAAPPDFETPMPEGYPTMKALGAAGWLPVPRARLPFRSIVAASRNDPLASFERVVELARVWGGELVDLGEVGHLNPASGYGEWPRAEDFIRELATTTAGRPAVAA